MAETKAEMSELDDLAFQIFSQRATSGKRSGEREARNAYAQAQAFLDTREKIKSGKYSKVPDKQRMADCCAPNLGRFHPLNLVAETFTDRVSGKQMPGDLALVKRVNNWLNTHMKPDLNQEEFLATFRAEFQDLKWDMPTVNVARAVFPAFSN